MAPFRSGRAARIALCGLGLAACSPPPAPPAADARETRATMADIVGALQVALPLALSDARFAAPESREALLEALAALRDSSAALRAHGRERDASFAYLSRSLALDAEEIERRFREGRTAEARFLLGELFEDCVGCHSRLPSAKGSDLGSELFRGAESASLGPGERIRLLVATRQFERALDEYEALFAAYGAEAPSAAELELEGLLGGYLRVAVRVQGDLERAERGLSRVAARDDVPPQLARRLDTWREALAELELVGDDRDGLLRARDVIARGDVLRDYPMDSTSLVHDLVASSDLHRFLATGTATRDEAAEAYYWLGVTELREERSEWLSQAESHLETAIRTAPGSVWAARAYDALEQETLAGYSGSAGEQLPPDIQRWLEELAATAEGPPPDGDTPEGEAGDPVP